MTLIAGKYQLRRKLATGGMAEVFLAKAEGPGGFEKTLVLKFILPHLAQEPSFVEMFHSEATLAAQLSHPHIVQIFDFGEDNGAYFLAMEYIDGPSLRALIKAAAAEAMALPPALCARLIAQACEGLAFAHDLTDPETGIPVGIIHRDISPDNLLLTRQGALKVVDFGIAKATGQQHKTESGVVKGKLSYMPPEQLRARSLDRRADVYALGMVLYELLTFHKPYRSESEAGLMQTILFEPPVPASQYRPDLPEALLAIIARATAKEREERYPDCHALQSDLEEFILSAGKPVTAQQVAQFIQQAVPKPTLPLPTPPAGSLVAPRVVSQTRAEAPTTLLDRAPTEGSASSSPTRLEKGAADSLASPSTTRLDRMRAEAAASPAPAPVEPRPPRASPRSKRLPLVGAALLTVTILGTLWRVTTVEKRSDTPSAPAVSTASVQPVTHAPATQETKGLGAQEGVGGSGDVQPAPSATSAAAPATSTVATSGEASATPSAPPSAPAMAGATPPAVAAAAVTAATPPSVTAAAETPPAEPARPARPSHGVTRAPARRAQASVMGKLNVRAYPYADVFVDDEFRGTTPIAKGLDLPVGRHSVRFENSDYKPDVQWIEVKEGEAVQAVARFVQSHH